jgi:hypothetical protein
MLRTQSYISLHKRLRKRCICSTYTSNVNLRRLDLRILDLCLAVTALDMLEVRILLTV